MPDCRLCQFLACRAQGTSELPAPLQLPGDRARKQAAPLSSPEEQAAMRRGGFHSSRSQSRDGGPPSSRAPRNCRTCLLAPRAWPRVQNLHQAGPHFCNVHMLERCCGAMFGGAWLGAGSRVSPMQARAWRPDGRAAGDMISKRVAKGPIDLTKGPAPVPSQHTTAHRASPALHSNNPSK